MIACVAIVGPKVRQRQLCNPVRAVAVCSTLLLPELTEAVWLAAEQPAAGASA